MRKFALALAAFAALGIAALPAVSAQAETVVIKKRHHDRGWHEGWHHHHGKVVVIKH
jgi:hypothetical protein